MNEPPDKPPDRVEQYGQFFAEYRRMRDSRGEEHLLVTVRRDTVNPDDTLRLRKFSLDMDTLERFASHEVPKEELSKQFDAKKPDRVERFREFEAYFHAGTKNDRQGSVVRLTFAKEGGEKRAVQSDLWVLHDALKEFAARGVEYEQELGHTKRWRPVVRVTALGESEGTGVAQALTSIQDEPEAIARAQLDADRSVERVLWSEAFRKPFAEGDEFTVRDDTEGHIGYGKIGIGIGRQLWMRDRVGQTHVVVLWHEGSCDPAVGMAVRFSSPFEPHTGRAREMLAFPEGGNREPGYPKGVEYLLVEVNPGRRESGIVKERFSQDVAKAVEKLHEVEQLHRVLQQQGTDLSMYNMPRGFRP